MAQGDWQDARFRSRVHRKDRNKTGLTKMPVWWFTCKACGKQYKVYRQDQVPEFCSHPRMMTGEPCGGEEFTVGQEVGIEAMPIGRVHTDLRSPSQMGRKGKTR